MVVWVTYFTSSEAYLEQYIHMDTRDFLYTTLDIMLQMPNRQLNSVDIAFHPV